MLAYLTLLLVCQLIGEVIARLAGLPVPGPVLGMVILFAGLLLNGGLPDGLEKVGGALLEHLSLLFVPAGVGVMTHLSLVRAEWVPITAALLASTVITIAVTALVMRGIERLGAGAGAGDER